MPSSAMFTVKRTGVSKTLNDYFPIFLVYLSGIRCISFPRIDILSSWILRKIPPGIFTGSYNNLQVIIVTFKLVRSVVSFLNAPLSPDIGDHIIIS